MRQGSTISSVFKTSRDLPENYVIRENIDDKFIEALTQETHVVIYGSSKQGKTSLRKKNLLPSDYIDITCSNNWMLEDIHVAILKKIGYQVTTSQSKTLKGTAKVKIGINIPFISKASFDLNGDAAKTINKKNIELDPEDVNDIISSLDEVNFKKIIVIEDFHYLPEQTQIDFSVALKAFHESSKLCFIIVGVWLEEDKLTTFNGDLAGRIVSINADRWEKDDVYKLFDNSEKLLNIKFDDKFKLDVVEKCNGSVFLVQQLCFQACELEQVNNTQVNLKTIGVNFSVEEKIKELVNEQYSRYFKFLTDFSCGFGQTSLELYKWILYVLITVEQQYLEIGIPEAAIRRMIQEKHPKRMEASTKKLRQALQKSVDLQVKISIKPIVFEFDSSSSRVKIVDRPFILWRSYQDRNELYGYADLSDDLKANIITPGY
ncbi:hypothetical protein AAGU66_08835 [Edwardsiella ictaluri]|uniref:hypothetical protein n=1 Tax=Edwardsiella ictaluri TaxID=67780 RepID=UPI0018DE2A18|nr:hypothetical protein [Edwardsiella ictaluri]QPW30186.1 hypothetical protein F8539_09485 [Edwardsiella ictaluri]UYB60315.1 hypothetical protein N8I66_09365 [Edwardsiella ictaluri]UYB63542.1 hypothetical protein N8I67_09360 [Edwardsiella ictaluri]WJH21212.1 hypothetical protein FGU63_09490 [Edwardsiella ictaluri]BEH99089.1 hypothetical protein KH20906_18170 [Edwardsiella ictaluri]